jgi:hypothetical protein
MNSQRKKSSTPAKISTLARLSIAGFFADFHMFSMEDHSSSLKVDNTTSYRESFIESGNLAEGKMVLRRVDQLLTQKNTLTH